MHGAIVNEDGAVVEGLNMGICGVIPGKAGLAPHLMLGIHGL
jgi:dihydrodipicolinate synthase/N-acetylneuraminate lyase